MDIIQFSDIHGSSDLLSAMEKLVHGIDLVIVSGDVTSFGQKNYFDEFMKTLAATGVRSLYVPGNNDLPGFRLPRGVESIDGKKLEIDGLFIGGVGGSPPTPFNTPNEIPEEELARRLSNLGSVDILVSHSPPYGTPSDQLKNGGHVGSRSVGEYILKNGPRLVLCGHVHEAVSKFQLGKSQVVNPGSAYERRYSRIRLEDEGVRVSLLVF
jgi:Icc-related predicted phosphoesterase